MFAGEAHVRPHSPGQPRVLGTGRAAQGGCGASLVPAAGTLAPEGCWELGPCLTREPQLHTDLEAGAQALGSTCDPPPGGSGLPPPRRCLSHTRKTGAQMTSAITQPCLPCRPSSPTSTASVGQRGCRDWSQGGAPSQRTRPPTWPPSQQKPTKELAALHPINPPPTHPLNLSFGFCAELGFVLDEPRLGTELSRGRASSSGRTPEPRPWTGSRGAWPRRPGRARRVASCLAPPGPASPPPPPPHLCRPFTLLQPRSRRAFSPTLGCRVGFPWFPATFSLPERRRPPAAS